MKKNKLLIFLMMIGVGIFVFSSYVFAVDTLGTGMLQGSVAGLGLESDLENSVANVIKTVLAITGTVFLVLTIAGGLMWMTASGNEEKISKAKKIIIGAVIGLAITLSAYTITSFVASRVGGSGQTCAEAGGVCLTTAMDCNTQVLNASCPSGQECCKQ